jgi:hypothetical protein
MKILLATAALAAGFVLSLGQAADAGNCGYSQKCHHREVMGHHHRGAHITIGIGAPFAPVPYYEPEYVEPVPYAMEYVYIVPQNWRSCRVKVRHHGHWMCRVRRHGY